MTDLCSHCPDGHDNPLNKPWGVYVSANRDGDSQPTTLHVAPSGGSHVAESDAEWLRGLIRGEQASASQIVGEILAPLNGRLAAAEAEGIAAHRRAEQAEAVVGQARAQVDILHGIAKGITNCWGPHAAHPVYALEQALRRTLNGETT